MGHASARHRLRIHILATKDATLPSLPITGKHDTLVRIGLLALTGAVLRRSLPWVCGGGRGAPKQQQHGDG